MSSYSCCKVESTEFGQLASLAPTLKLVADQNRLRILCILQSGRHCVCDLIDHLNISQSLVSHHLKDLKVGGLIQDEKLGLYVHYELTPKGKKIADTLFSLLG